MASDTRHEPPAPDPRVGRLRTLIVLSALMAFASISTDLYLPAMPALAVALRADPADVQLTLSAFLAGFSVGQLLWGPIGDRYGRRFPVAAGLVLFMIGSAGCALSDTVWQMMGWRVVQALGACAGPVLARAMVRDLFARERSAQMLSTLMTVMAIAPLLGPLIGGQILLVTSWQGIFWTLVGIGLLALAGILSLPETLPREKRNPQPLAGALIGYLDLVRSPRLVGYALAGGFFYGGLFAQVAGTPFAYIDYHGVSPQAYGLLFGITVAGLMVTNIMNTRLVMRLGSDRIFAFGAAIAALSGVVLALDARFGWGGLIGLVLPLFVYVSMAGFVVANSVAGALAAYPHKAGAASALVGAAHSGTGVLSAAMVGWFADGTPGPMGFVIGLGGLGTFAIALMLLHGRWRWRA